MLRRPAHQALLVAGLAGAVAVFLAWVPLHRRFFDLGVYYGSINFWLRDGGPLYDYLRPPENMGFTYPPFAALAMSPLALLSWYQAVALGVVLTVAAAGLTLHWLLDPIAARQRWPRWLAFAIAACLLAVYEPMRDTVSLGQINMVLLAMVLADVRLLRAGNRFAGILIGLAAAIKLTPAIFIVYLLLTRRWRAAAVAAGAAGGATLLAAVVAPDSSRRFWTDAVWDTSRVGELSYVSNQSLLGMLARFAPAHPSRGLWLLLVAATLAVWAVRAYRVGTGRPLRLRAGADAGWRKLAGSSWSHPAGSAPAPADRRDGNDLAGFALTGIVACLVSPITWVHHLIWLLPALVILLDTGLAATGPRRLRLLAGGATAYVLLCSSVVWLWLPGADDLVGMVGSSSYVWISMTLLLTMPAPDVRPPVPSVPSVSPEPLPSSQDR